MRNPVTTVVAWPEFSWQILLIAAVGMALDGSVTTAWLNEAID